MGQATPKPKPWWLKEPLTVVAVLFVSVLAVGSAVWGLRARRLTAEQRLDQLASLPPDMPLEALTRALPWLECTATTAQESTRFDHACVWKGSRIMVVAATLDTRLASIIVHQVPAGPNLETWARARYDTPSGSCARDVGGHRTTLLWWTGRPQAISVSWSSAHGDLPVRELVFRSHRLGQSPSCEDDTGGARLRSERGVDR